VSDELEGLAGAVGSGACDDRHAAGRMLYGELYDAAMFVVTEGGGLTGSAAGSEAVDVSFD
jgi:hypothetical protein